MNKNKLIQLSLCLPTSLTIITASCSEQTQYIESAFEIKFNNYAEEYQTEFLDDLTYKYHDGYHCEDLYCASEAEAVIMGTYGPGYLGGGSLLHNGQESEMPTMEDVYVTLGIPDPKFPRDLDKHIERVDLPLRPGDYHYLDEAIAHSTCGKPLTVYHGYEFNEVEMMNDINSALGVSNILTTNPETTTTIDCNAKLKNKTIKDLSWCATTFEEGFALGWANGNVETEDGQTLYNVPVYKLDIDPDVHCAYVSYSRKTGFDGIYLAWPHEFQLLTERNLSFVVNSAQGIKRPDHPGYFLYMDCHVSSIS